MFLRLSVLSSKTIPSRLLRTLEFPVLIANMGLPLHYDLREFEGSLTVDGLSYPATARPSIEPRSNQLFYGNLRKRFLQREKYRSSRILAYPARSTEPHSPRSMFGQGHIFDGENEA